MRINLSSEEKHVIEKLSAISCLDESTIKKVLESLLVYTALEAYDDKREVHVPFIGKIGFEYQPTSIENKLSYEISMKTSPSDLFQSELIKVKKGEMTTSESFVKQRIASSLVSIIKDK